MICMCLKLGCTSLLDTYIAIHEMIMLQASVCMSLNLSPSVHLQSVPVLASVLLLMAMLPSARPNLWEVWQVIIATLASI